MVRSFRSKALEEAFNGTPRYIEASLRNTVDNILTTLNAAQLIEDMDLPSYRLHELKGDRAGTWSVRLNHNWRVTFRFDSGDIFDVDFEDYHGD